jgi:nucleoside-diphosphate-sugar epimerase
MHAFITGGGGFIGSHLVERLRAEGHRATVLLAPGETAANLPGDVPTVTADLLDDAALSRVVPPCDVFYHLAARTDLRGTTLGDYAVNTLGTTHALAAAKRAGATRFVCYSSMLAAALPRDATPVDETHDAPPATAYGRSKRDAEQRVAAGPLPYTILRPTFVYGPRERSTIFALLRAIDTKRFVLIGRDVPQSYCYVGNLVRATVEASLHPDAANQTFLISDARPYTLAEFARAAADALHVRLPRTRLPKAAALAVAYPLAGWGRLTRRPVPLFPSRVRTMTSPYVYSIDRARGSFGYAPPDTLPAFMQATVNEARAARAL